MPFETTSELYDLLTQLTSERNPSSTTRTTLLGLLDSAHRQIINGGGILNTTGSLDQRTSPEQFAWLPVVEEVLILQPYESYTLTVTNGSASATLSSAPSASRTGWYAYFDNSIYKLSGNSGTSVTLDSLCQSSTGDYSVKLYKLDYTLSTTNVLRMTDDPLRVSPGPKQVSVISDDKISDTWLYSAPKVAAITQLSFKLDLDGNVTVRIPSIYDKAQRVLFKLLQRPAELDLVSEDPILPKDYREMIAYLAAHMHLYRRDDTRANQYLALAMTKFREMVNEYRSRFRQQGKYEFAKARLMRATTRSGVPNFIRRIRGW